MYDYMKALQERFDEKQPEQLVYAVQSAREGLRDGIDAESRRKLLRLLDAQNALLVEAKLMSFTAGFKLHPVPPEGNSHRSPRFADPDTHSSCHRR